VNRGQGALKGTTAAVVSKQTVKLGCKKAAVSGTSLESNPGEKVMHHAACSMCNRGCCNYSLFGLEVDDSRLSECSSPPPSEKVKTRGRSAASVPKGMPLVYHLKCPSPSLVWQSQTQVCSARIWSNAYTRPVPVAKYCSPIRLQNVP